LFEAVQEKLAADALARQVRLRSSAALLTGRFLCRLPVGGAIRRGNVIV
jgi:hypothetical protein